METNKFIIDIFPEFILTDEYTNIFRYSNIQLANNQQIMINQLIVYIKSNVYFGEEYHEYLDKQKQANKWWISTFFTKDKPEFDKLVKSTIHYNESELNLFVKNL